jgi:hypothetical protein
MTKPITATQTFSVEINGKVKRFNTLAEATEAVAKIELAATARAYVEARGYEGKNAEGKFNVVLDFLAYNAAAASATPAVDPEAFVQA